MLHINPADHYHGGHSRLHRLDPRIKTLGALAFIAATALLPDGVWLSLGLLLMAIVSVAGLAHLGWAYALKRSFVALPFALAAVALPFTMPGQTLAQWGQLTVSMEGTVRLLSIVLKAWISVQAALLLTALTPFHDLLWSLRALRVPSLLVGVIGFMYRYLFVLGDEALRLL